MQEENYDESELNGYLLDTHFLCIIFEEPSPEYITDAQTKKKKRKKVPLRLLENAWKMAFWFLLQRQR